MCCSCSSNPVHPKMKTKKKSFEINNFQLLFEEISFNFSCVDFMCFLLRFLLFFSPLFFIQTLQPNMNQCTIKNQITHLDPLFQSEQGYYVRVDTIFFLFFSFFSFTLYFYAIFFDWSIMYWLWVAPGA